MSLLAAVKSGNIEAVRDCLTRGVSVNEKKGTNGSTILHYACRHSKIEIVKMLVKAGARLETKDSYGRTPLLVALHRIVQSCDETTRKEAPFSIDEEDLKIVEALLNAKADVTAKDVDKVTSLHFAAVIPSEKIFLALMNSGAEASIDHQDVDGFTPVHCAVRYDNEKILSLLIRASADVNVKNRNGYTPLHLAVAVGKVQLATVLIEAGASLRIKNGDGMTPLLLALHVPLKRVEDALKNRKNSADIVMSEEDLDITRLLLDLGSDATAKQKDGKTALHMAAILPSVEVFMMLTSFGALETLNRQDRGGFTPLHYAVRYGNVEILHLLVKAKAYLNVRNWFGHTSLHLAVCTGRKGIVKKLIKSGANVEVKDNSGKTPLLLALETILNQGDNTQILRTTRCSAKITIYRNDVKIVKLLLEADADVDVRTNAGKTPLHYAAILPCKRILEMLIDAGADDMITEMDNRGYAPTDYAVMYGNKEIWELLNLVRGRKLDGKNPLKIAIRFCRTRFARRREEARFREVSTRFRQGTDFNEIPQL